VRPASITWFERLYVGSLAITLGMIAMLWESVRTGMISPATLLLGLAFSIILPLVLIFLVSRRRSVVAKWVLVAIVALGLVANWLNYRPGGDLLMSLVALSIIAMQTVAVGLLFTAPAWAWLTGKDSPSSGAALRQTFD
jgi:hypothetical protein